jgi:hypothetical protein
MAFSDDKNENSHMEHAVDSVSLMNINNKDADIVQAEVVAAGLQNGRSQAEKDLVRKIDWRVLPCVWTLYLLGFLDRANVGYVNWRDKTINHDVEERG